MATQITETPASETETALTPPWSVIVHNDPVNLMSYVALVFRRVFGYATERAQKHMLEVHERGRSVLWTGEREKAELYVQQLHGYLLLATLERAGD
jgi:ATP-dependent Clp protease adaptor protein ClpS